MWACALGPFVAAAMLMCAGYSGYLLACLVVPSATPSFRGVAAGILALALSQAVFTILLEAEQFRRDVALASWVVLAGIAARTAGYAARARIRRDAAGAQGLVRSFLRSRVRTAVAAAGVCAVAVRETAAIVSPPLAWDSLLYHFVKPATWVASGRDFVDRAPDLWGYQEFFPRGGWIAWAWAMLATGDDRLVSVATVLPWGLMLLGSHGLARAVGARPLPAALASLSTAVLPATLTQIGTGYVDAHAVAIVLLGAAAFAEMARRPSGGRLFLCATALGLVAAAKGWGWLVVVVWGSALLLLAAAPWRARPARRVLPIVLAAASFAALALPGPLRALRETGEFFYPFDLRFKDVILARGNEELRLLYSGALFNLPTGLGGVPAAVDYLFFPSAASFGRYGGFGPGAVLALFLFVASLADRRAQWSAKPWVLLVLAVAACLPILEMSTEAYRLHRVVWISSIGRLGLACPAVFAALAARTDGPLPRAVWLTSALASLLAAWPSGLAPPIPRAAAALAGPAVLCLAAALLAHFTIGQRASARVGLVALLVLLGCPLAKVRDGFREAIWAATLGRRPPFLFEPLTPRCASAAPIWRALDDGQAHLVALAVGWNGFGDNSFRYPLLGSRLQNRIVYLPVTADGSVIDYRLRGEVTARADERTWLRRVRDSGVDVVVALGPAPPEAAWLAAHPERFELLAESSDGLHAAYVVRR